MEYENLLDKLYREVKPIETKHDRFEIPKVKGYIEGNKTIIINFMQICSLLRRKPEHLTKFLSRELAALSIVKDDRIVFNRKLLSSKINEKLLQYVHEFVLCRECKKPDTELVKQGEFLFLHCLACGAKHSVRAKIV